MEISDFKVGMYVKLVFTDSILIEKIVRVTRGYISFECVYSSDRNFIVGNIDRITKGRVMIINYQIDHEYKINEDIKEWINEQI